MRTCVCVHAPECTRVHGEEGEEGCQRQSESQREEEKESAEEKRGREESGNLRKNESRGQRGAKKKRSVTRTKRKCVKIEGNDSKGKRRRR